MTFDQVRQIQLKLLEGKEVSMEELRDAIATVREARMSAGTPTKSAKPKAPTPTLEQLSEAFKL